VLLTPVSVCAILRLRCAAYSGLPVRHAPVFAFDRDLYAFRGFFDYNRISIGVLVTRSSELQQYFTTLGTYEDAHHVIRQISAKYGASTTHMDKLISRLNQGRSGGCPVFALGIKTSLIVKVE
jgi:CRISPR-associated protein Csd2